VTQGEYRREYRGLRAACGKKSLELKSKVRKLFAASITSTTKAVRAHVRGDNLSESARDAIIAALGKSDLSHDLRGVIATGIDFASASVAKIDATYLVAAVRAAHAEKVLTPEAVERGITRTASRIAARRKNALDAGFVRIERAARAGIVENRLRYSLSDSIWKALDRYQAQILAIVQGGINQTRDGVAIAGDLESFLTGGPEAVLGRWGNLLPGAAEYVARLGTAGVDYRTMRLVRSEMYADLQETATWMSEINPASSGEVDWLLQEGRVEWPCDCADLAAGGPYKTDEVPAYPHPNCMCTVQTRLMDHDDFLKDLVDYAKGGDTAGASRIEKWAQTYIDE
jgi:hypothetical protein